MPPTCPLCGSDAVILATVPARPAHVACVACGSVCPAEFLGAA